MQASGLDLWEPRIENSSNSQDSVTLHRPAACSIRKLGPVSECTVLGGVGEEGGRGEALFSELRQLQADATPPGTSLERATHRTLPVWKMEVGPLKHSRKQGSRLIPVAMIKHPDKDSRLQSVADGIRARDLKQLVTPTVKNRELVPAFPSLFCTYGLHYLPPRWCHPQWPGHPTSITVIKTTPHTHVHRPICSRTFLLRLS